MNESTLTQLKILVERAVRPVRASMSRKCKMREELLAHVSAVFEEEVARLANERAALERTAQRFGNPAELTGQLQKSVPAIDDFALRFLEGMALRTNESTLRRAVRYTRLTFFVFAGLLLPAFFVQSRMNEWPVLLVIPATVFCFVFLADWMRQALEGNGGRGRSLGKAAVVAAASWFLMPSAVVGMLLIYSSDVRSSLAEVLPLLPAAVLTPVLFALPVYGFANEFRSNREWASLQIN